MLPGGTSGYFTRPCVIWFSWYGTLVIANPDFILVTHHRPHHLSSPTSHGTLLVQGYMSPMNTGLLIEPDGWASYYFIQMWKPREMQVVWDPPGPPASLLMMKQSSDLWKKYSVQHVRTTNTQIAHAMESYLWSKFLITSNWTVWEISACDVQTLLEIVWFLRNLMYLKLKLWYTWS